MAAVAFTAALSAGCSSTGGWVSIKHGQPSEEARRAGTIVQEQVLWWSLQPKALPSGTVHVWWEAWENPSGECHRTEPVPFPVSRLGDARDNQLSATIGTAHGSDSRSYLVLGIDLMGTPRSLRIPLESSTKLEPLKWSAGGLRRNKQMAITGFLCWDMSQTRNLGDLPWDDRAKIADLKVELIVRYEGVQSQES